MIKFFFLRRIRSIPQSHAESQFEVHTHAHTHERRLGRGNGGKETEEDSPDNVVMIPPPLSTLQTDQDENIGKARTYSACTYLHLFSIIKR